VKERAVVGSGMHGNQALDAVAHLFCAVDRIGAILATRVEHRQLHDSYASAEQYNLEQAKVLNVHKADCIVYGKTRKQLLAHKEKILLVEPNDVKDFEILKQTLFNIKRTIMYQAFDDRVVQAQKRRSPSLSASQSR